MPGRKNPERTESERDRAYRTWQKRSYGDNVASEQDLDVEQQGAVEKVRREREKWARADDAESRQNR